jgi:uncharacterized protein with PIN domain
VLDEPAAEQFRIAVEEDTTCVVSTATLRETALVIEARKGELGGCELDVLIQKAVGGEFPIVLPTALK